MIFEPQKILDDDRYIKMSIVISEEVTLDRESIQKGLNEWAEFLLWTTIGMLQDDESKNNIAIGFYKVVETEKERLRKLVEDGK